MTLTPLFVTALGHFEDTPLLEKVADKKFITPSALGSYLNELYNQTVAELQNSKAKLVDDITKQLKTQYDKEIGNLREQIQNIQVMNTANVKNLKDQLQSAFSMHQQQLQEKDRLLKNAEGLTENFKSEVSRLREELNRKAAEPPPQNYSWLIVIAAVVLLIVALKTCR